MTLHFKQVSSENDVKKRKISPGINSLVIQGIFGEEVTNIDAEISQITLDKATELLWIISSGYKKSGLETDAFQVPYKIEVPAKKLFMAGELVVTQQDEKILGDVVMYNGMRSFTDNSGKITGYAKSQTHINLELPLSEYRGVTREILGRIWGILDKLETTKSGQPMIAYISRGVNGNEIVKSEGYKALEDAEIKGLVAKPLYDSSSEIDDFL